jgi:glutathionylspermidine synthase
MQRITCRPRKDWEKTVEAQGLIFHHTPRGVYWNESAYYRFGAKEVDVLEAATNEVQRLCLEAGQHIIDQNRFAELGIPEKAVPLITWAWDAEPPAIYGRLDLACDGRNPPKLLEYNADTPTSLLEAAVVQWYWLQDCFPRADQFNSIHERLIAKWKDLHACLTGAPLYFAHVEDREAEDLMTVSYLRDTAEQAGLGTAGIVMEHVGWNQEAREFRDLSEQPIRSVFKLYPWEWIVWEEFGDHVLETYREMQWIEPIWKMMWSNKGLLAILWELFPNHPNLLEAHLRQPGGLTDYVRKPLLSREGANITYLSKGTAIETEGDYGEEGFVYQAIGPVPELSGNRAVIGSWIIDGEAGGMGVREADGPITDNLSRFVPHMFD